MQIYRYLFSYQCLLICLILFTAVIYYPGLNSGFLLDDNYNLGTLDLIDTKGFSYFVFGGESGPSGRPLSLLSFALQYQDWPSNPFAFKLVNLIIHLVNGVLIFFVCRFLTVHFDHTKQEINVFCFLVTALWLIHPIQVSTVLYTVQRMTELSAFFTLSGLLLYLYGRSKTHENSSFAPYLYMSLAVVFGVNLGVLSKESGILLPLFILVIEYTIFHGNSKTTRWRIWAWVFLVLPLVMLMTYFAYSLNETLWSYQNRAFTITQRLLTEPIILFDYLRVIVAPYIGAFSLFHDDYPIATGLLSPPHSLFAISAILLLFIFSVWKRKKYTPLCFAILWFLAGHVLESTFINLELYFEHRNYLPSFGIFFIETWFVLLCWRRLKNRVLTITLVAGYSVLVLGITITEVHLWSNPAKQALEWSRTHPNSNRAIDSLGSIFLTIGDYENAMKTYGRINENKPLDLYPYLKDISIRYCLLNEKVPDEQWEEILILATRAKTNGVGLLLQLDSLVKSMVTNTCNIGQPEKLSMLISLLAENPDFEKSRDFFFELVAVIAIQTNDIQLALSNINKSIAIVEDPDRYILKIKILMALENIEELELTLNEFRKLISRNPKISLAFLDIINKYELELLELKSKVSP